MKSMVLFWRNLYYFQMLMYYSGSSERFKTNFRQHLLHLGRFPLYSLIMCVFFALKRPLEGLSNFWGSAITTIKEYETNSNVYLDLGLNYQILFQSHTMLRLWGVAGSEVSDWPCSLYLLSPTLLPCRQATKRVLHYRWVWKVSFAKEFCTKKLLWDGCCI